MKLSEAPDDVLVRKFVEIREARAQRKAKYTEDDSADKGRQEKIEAEFLRRFNERGSTSSACKGVGTAYLNNRTSASVADRDVFFNFLRDSDAWELLEMRCSKTAVEAYKAANGDLPPGVNWSEELTVGFRRG